MQTLRATRTSCARPVRSGRRLGRTGPLVASSILERALQCAPAMSTSTVSMAVFAGLQFALALAYALAGLAS
jgi:hypothetical protein